MTEQELERKVEASVARLEQRIEGTADRFDKAVARKWEQRSFRAVLKSISFITEIGLIAGSIFLSREGRKTWAGVCSWLGIAGLLWEMFQLMFLRRKK